MKLIQIEHGPLVFHPKNGFPVTRGKGTIDPVLTYKFRPDGISIPIDPSLASAVPGSLLLNAGVKLDANGAPTLVPETDPASRQFPAGAVLVSAAYNDMSKHIRFESNHSELGVIYSYIPEAIDNWSLRSFLAVMLPGTVISFVVHVPVRRYESGSSAYSWENEERKVPLLLLSEETGRFEYLFNEVPFMDTDNDWMKTLNRSADDDWKRKLHQRRYG